MTDVGMGWGWGNQYGTPDMPSLPGTSPLPLDMRPLRLGSCLPADRIDCIDCSIDKPGSCSNTRFQVAVHQSASLVKLSFSSAPSARERRCTGPLICTALIVHSPTLRVEATKDGLIVVGSSFTTALLSILEQYILLILCVAGGCGRSAYGA